MALILMCGLSFAGKSTFAKLLAKEMNAEVVSLDAINAERGLHGGQGIPLDEWAFSDRIAHERVETHLRRGRQVIVDDTGSPRFLRDQWRTTANTVGMPFVIIWVVIGPELQRERVTANRSSKERQDVTDAVLADHGAAFEAPHEENPLVVDALFTNDRNRVIDIAASIRRLTER